VVEETGEHGVEDLGPLYVGEMCAAREDHRFGAGNQGRGPLAVSPGDETVFGPRDDERFRAEVGQGREDGAEDPALYPKRPHTAAQHGQERPLGAGQAGEDLVNSHPVPRGAPWVGKAAGDVALDHRRPRPEDQLPKRRQRAHMKQRVDAAAEES